MFRRVHLGNFTQLIHDKWRGCSPIDEVVASPVDARVAPTLVHLRQTGGVVVALRAQAGEAVDSIDASTSVVTWVDGTVVNVQVTHRT